MDDSEAAAVEREAVSLGRLEALRSASAKERRRILGEAVERVEADARKVERLTRRMADAAEDAEEAARKQRNAEGAVSGLQAEIRGQAVEVANKTKQLKSARAEVAKLRAELRSAQPSPASLASSSEEDGRGERRRSSLGESGSQHDHELLKGMVEALKKDLRMREKELKTLKLRLQKQATVITGLEGAAEREGAKAEQRHRRKSSSVSKK